MALKEKQRRRSSSFSVLEFLWFMFVSVVYFSFLYKLLCCCYLAFTVASYSGALLWLMVVRLRTLCKVLIFKFIKYLIILRSYLNN